MGAAPLGIAAVVLRWCGLLLAAGLALGLGGWAALSRVVEGLFYDVRPLDGWSIAAAVGFLALATFAAAIGPAWRASRIERAAPCARAGSVRQAQERAGGQACRRTLAPAAAPGGRERRLVALYVAERAATAGDPLGWPAPSSRQ